MSLVVINNVAVVVAGCQTSAHYLICSGVRTSGAVPPSGLAFTSLSEEFLVCAALILK